MDACPRWCARHTAARCRSQPEVVTWQTGPLAGQVGAQLEAWHGREHALVLLPASQAPIYLPRQAAQAFGAAVGGLLVAAGWASVPVER